MSSSARVSSLAGQFYQRARELDLLARLLEPSPDRVQGLLEAEEHRDGVPWVHPDPLPDVRADRPGPNAPVDGRGVDLCRSHLNRREIVERADPLDDDVLQLIGEVPWSAALMTLPLTRTTFLPPSQLAVASLPDSLLLRLDDSSSSRPLMPCGPCRP